MKQALVLLALLLVASVSAGSIYDLDFEDCSEFKEECVDWECRFWWHSHCVWYECVETQTECKESAWSEINDGDVQVDADTLEGYSSSNFFENVQYEIGKLNKFSRWDMREYLYNEFHDWLWETYLYDLFERMARCERYNYDNQNRIFMLQERVQALEQGE